MHDLSALVVDDSKVGRLTMMKKLEAMGLKVALAESGQEAIDYLGQHRPDAIFMDHMMPEMDGFEVTRRLKASPATRDIPVIIISGNDEASFVAQARAAGAIDAITKPPANDVLENLLAALPLASATAAGGLMPQSAPTLTLDMDTVHALVARLLEEAVMSLRASFQAEIDQRQEAEFERQHQALQWRDDRLVQQGASLAQLRAEGAADAERTGKRLQALEAQVGRPQPDFAELQADIERRIAAGLGGLQTQVGNLSTQLPGLRQGLEALQANAGERDSRFEHQMEAWGSRLNVFADELAQMRDKARRLAVATAVGGGLLLIALVVAVFKG